MPAFADTNVVYAFATDDAKIAVAEGILEKQPTISVQVVSEFLNVCRAKLGMNLPARHKLAAELIAGCNVVSLDPLVVEGHADRGPSPDFVLGRLDCRGGIAIGLRHALHRGSGDRSDV